MTAIQYYLGLLILATIVTGILFVLFGQITVRKLRKNPNAKDALGLEIINGWDIINVAQALTIPRSLSKALNKGLIASFFANKETIIKHTNRFDRALGISLYIFLITTTFSTLIFVFLEAT